MSPDPPTVPVPIKKRRFTLIFLYFTVLPVLEGIWWVSVDVFSLRPELKMYVLRGTFPSGHLRPDLRNLATRFSESLHPWNLRDVWCLNHLKNPPIFPGEKRKKKCESRAALAASAVLRSRGGFRSSHLPLPSSSESAAAHWCHGTFQSLGIFYKQSSNSMAISVMGKWWLNDGKWWMVYKSNNYGL